MAEVAGTRAWAEIDLDALRANVAALCAALAPKTRLMAVVKADAYGHGLLPIARTAVEAGAEWLGVATVGEGAALRAAGLRAPIGLLCAPTPQEAETIVSQRLTALVGDRYCLDALVRAASLSAEPTTIHLDIDTGMGRSGALPEEAVALWQSALASGLRVTGLATHFADADGDDPTLSQQQEATFRQVYTALQQAGARFDLLHLSNSAATLRFPGTQADLVRPGLLLYGIFPPQGEGVGCRVSGVAKKPLAAARPSEHGKLRPVGQRHPMPDTRHPALQGLGLIPVLTLKARVASVRALPAGHPISYGATHRLTRPSIVATVLIGYGDGYPRRLSNRGHLLLHGQRAPILGRVCMDQTVVDVTEIPGVAPGDVAICIGVQGTECIRVEEIARLIETTEHEITTCLTARIPRCYLPESA